MIDTMEPLAVRVETTRDLTLTLKSGANERTLEFSAGESNRTVARCDRGSDA
ncbi:hypothetical protein [Haloterrigena salifodinae]|uniref:Uncharacterized protein n=1 Tax=Haloterrigena salifodinae TaxID=2675099 RepID=A0A8T8E4Y2_9EURY|nr:hypothetical protein [Haloterrigena salifodinae]QRV16924.1 hypothetical protein JMJ58_08690 [Haloterrigena salifodinae]